MANIKALLFIGKTEQTFEQGTFNLVNIEPEINDNDELVQVSMYGSIGAETGENCVVPYWVLDLDTVEQIARIWNEYNQK